jgi:hypothetical protein
LALAIEVCASPMHHEGTRPGHVLGVNTSREYEVSWIDDNFVLGDLCEARMQAALLQVSANLTVRMGWNSMSDHGFECNAL